MTSGEFEVEVANLRGAAIAAAGCIVDLYQVVTILKSEMPIAGDNEELMKAIRSLEARMETLIERLDK